jgi:hypothetical protein
MFDRPTDSWYKYMRPFNVAILLQLRERQRREQLAHEEQQRREQQEKEKDPQPSSNTP